MTRDPWCLSGLSASLVLERPASVVWRVTWPASVHHRRPLGVHLRPSKGRTEASAYYLIRRMAGSLLFDCAECWCGGSRPSPSDGLGQSSLPATGERCGHSTRLVSWNMETKCGSSFCSMIRSALTSSTMGNVSDPDVLYPMLVYAVVLIFEFLFFFNPGLATSTYFYSVVSDCLCFIKMHITGGLTFYIG